MKKLARCIILLLILFSMFFAACSTSSDGPDENNGGNPAALNPDDEGNDPDDEPEGTEGKTGALIAVLERQGFEILKTVVINGDVGILAKLKNREDKRCIVLTGKPYSLGYQMGRLLPDGAYRMTKEYTYNLLEDYASVKQGSVLFNTIKNMVINLAWSAIEENAIPAYLVEEMKGVADGASSAGKNVTFEDVLVLNEGLDTLYSVLFSGKLPSTEGATKDSIGCNGFVVSGEATVDGKVYHGRDFMLLTGGVYQYEALMTVYIPDKGLPFVTLNAPGFVGQTTGLNSKGLSMGVDVVFGGATRSTPGMGCLLVIRDIIQNCSNLDSAVERMKRQNRGVSWVYVIADDEKSDKYTNGIVVESGMTFDENGNEYTGPEILPWFTRLSLSDLISKLPDEKPERGVLTRPQDWAYPEAFIGVENFPPQIEEYDDVVAACNHYIHPTMVFTTFSPWLQFLQGNYWKSSQTLQRYEDMTGRLIDNYGRIDFMTARDIIDFMNPNTGDWDRYQVNGEIEGHHDLFDNKDLIMECLWGFYRPDEPWIRVDLKPFITAFTDN